MDALDQLANTLEQAGDRATMFAQQLENLPANMEWRDVAGMFAADIELLNRHLWMISLFLISIRDGQPLPATNSKLDFRGKP